MGFLNYQIRPRVMVVGNGHAYDRSALMAMLESFEGMECFLVEHPIAEQLLNPQALAEVDALVIYDMPGGDPWSGPGYQVDPSPGLKTGFAALLRAGIPIVARHHAIAAWTTWPDCAEALGGALYHFPGTLRGQAVMDGGTRADLDMTITATDHAHPLFDGLPPSFTLRDDGYLMEVFADEVDVIATTDVELTCRNLYSMALAMTGERRSNRGWQRPDGNPAVAWTKRAGNSALAYIQPGHYGETFANPHYRRLVRNALTWTMAQSPWRAR